MKWFNPKSYLKDRLNEERVACKFLWFPTCLRDSKGKSVYKWLETTKYVEKICEVDVGGSMEYGNFAYMWCKDRWVD